MDNRLQFLSWLMLAAMLSMMIFQALQPVDPEARQLAAREPSLRLLSTMMAMGPDVQTDE